MINHWLSQRAPFDDSNVKHVVTIPFDADPINKQKRIIVYEKMRQMLLRAAKVKTPKMNDHDAEPTLTDEEENEFQIDFDLSKRLY